MVEYVPTRDVTTPVTALRSSSNSDLLPTQNVTTECRVTCANSQMLDKMYVNTSDLEIFHWPKVRTREHQSLVSWRCGCLTQQLTVGEAHTLNIIRIETDGSVGTRVIESNGGITLLERIELDGCCSQDTQDIDITSDVDITCTSRVNVDIASGGFDIVSRDLDVAECTAGRSNAAAVCTISDGRVRQCLQTCYLLREGYRARFWST